MARYFIDCLEGERVKGTSKDTPIGHWMEVPDGFTCERQHDYRLENGALVYDPLPQEPAAMTESARLAALEARAAMLNAMIQALASRGEFVEDCIAELAGVVYGE